MELGKKKEKLFEHDYKEKGAYNVYRHKLSLLLLLLLYNHTSNNNTCKRNCLLGETVG